MKNNLDDSDTVSSADVQKERGEIQVLYCDSKFWIEHRPLAEQVEQTFRWYLLECPFANIKSPVTARRRASKLKSKYGPRAQAIIIGKVEGQYEAGAADYISGITVLQESNAMECRAPSRIFTKKGTKPVFYPDLSELREGIMLLQILGHNLFGSSYEDR